MRVKIVCLNLWLGGILFDSIIRFLKEEKPDILLTQEAYGGENPNLERRFRSIDVLKNELGFEHVFFSPTCIAVLQERKIKTGNAIFSHLPILDSQTHFFDIPFGEVANYEAAGGDYSLTPRNLQHAVIKAGDANLNVFNTQGIWGENSDDNERRIAMGRTIAEKIQGKKKIVLGGDFNVKPHTQTMLSIEKDLTDPFEGKIKTTFNLQRKNNPIFANLIVDRLFVGKDLNAIDAYRPAVDVSDHLPLVCSTAV